MNSFYEKVERFVDKAIPYLIVLLLGILILDIFYKETAAKYHAPILIVDFTILAFFAVDLIFKYLRVHNIPRFLRLYWLDILAVFPFFLLLRLFEEVLLISERSAITLRNLFHIGLVFEEEAAVVARGAEEAAKTAEVLAKEGRLVALSEKLAFLRRVPRMFKAISFFEHPNQKKTLYHKKN